MADRDPFWRSPAVRAIVAWLAVAAGSAGLGAAVQVRSDVDALKAANQVRDERDAWIRATLAEIKESLKERKP